ncbi:MAG: ThiF family adenylyltransferase [Gammaproteobacteria bacterium]|nr:ThiF family adenylyltransferase [Gammaproteobacteria bacterium]
MSRFRFTGAPVEPTQLRAELSDPSCGGYAAFEGWVRDHSDGKRVTRLEYEAFERLGIGEGERIVEEARQRFSIENALCVHRVGSLAIGDMAVWVGVSAPHRDEAFRACRYIIDEVKHRVPIWKKEHYVSGDSGWVNCERCAAAGETHVAAREDEHDHAHARPGETARPDYSRQMVLREVGAAGQARLAAASVAVVGAGGLGVPVLGYLAGAGVGRLGIIDADRLDASNLHRQTLYALADVGALKAELAAARLRALNPELHLDVHALRLDAGNGPTLLRGHDLIVDCTDNFATKFLLNDLAQTLGIPLVLASVYQYEGQIQVVDPQRASACLRCIWPQATRDGLVGNCAEAGVLGPVPGVFGSLQALEALKILLDLPGRLEDELLVIDLLRLTSSRVRLHRTAECRGNACQRLPVASAPAGEEAPGELELSFASLDEALAAGYGVIDIREPTELAQRPTPALRSRHLPLGMLLERTRELPLAERHLLVCAHGARSLAAARELRARGIVRVYSLRGGIFGLTADTDRRRAAP